MTTFTIKWGSNRFTYPCPHHMAKQMRGMYRDDRARDTKYPLYRPLGGDREQRTNAKDHVAHFLLTYSQWSADA